MQAINEEMLEVLKRIRDDVNLDEYTMQKLISDVVDKMEGIKQ